MTNFSSSAVAETILQQLGGARFVAMTGAKHFVASERALHFKLPIRFARLGINHVTVKLDASDTYTVETCIVRGTRCTVVGREFGVYADALRAVFERETGLRTSL